MGPCPSRHGGQERTQAVHRGPMGAGLPAGNAAGVTRVLAAVPVPLQPQTTDDSTLRARHRWSHPGERGPTPRAATAACSVLRDGFAHGQTVGRPLPHLPRPSSPAPIEGSGGWRGRRDSREVRDCAASACPFARSSRGSSTHPPRPTSALAVGMRTTSRSTVRAPLLAATGAVPDGSRSQRLILVGR